MRRRSKLLLIACAAIVFLVLSAVLARWLAVDNAERNKVTALIEAEARGDAAAMLAQLHGCDSHCRAIVIADSRRLRRPGRVQILAYQSPTDHALSTATGTTRVAWKSSLQRLPVVQCVEVQRRGNAITGLSVTLLTLSAQIADTADC
ncbi:MAG: hypothetical protein ABSD82_02850 [Solirubrobacteraceae bacterium]|jgi:hypothetical protein